jgi:hypothetical protein
VSDLVELVEKYNYIESVRIRGGQATGTPTPTPAPVGQGPKGPVLGAHARVTDSIMVLEDENEGPQTQSHSKPGYRNNYL